MRSISRWIGQRERDGILVYMMLNAFIALILQMTKVFATARMYLKGQPILPMEHIYEITTFELG